VFQDFQTPSYAGFWLRLVAYIIDTVIMFLIFIPLSLALGLFAAASSDGGDEATMALLQAANMGMNLVSLVVTWLYSSLLESSSWQATVGKKLIGIRVTDMNGNRIGFGQATGRHFGKILSSLICLIGFIMAAFTEKQQALHDMLAGTLVLSGSAESVVYNPPPPPDFYGGAFTGR
jgi:uncharacterized RDD family membrane protein YckC